MILPKSFPPHKWLIFRLCIKYVLKHSDYVIAQSSNTRENAQKYYCSQTQIQIIPLPYQKVEFDAVTRQNIGLNVSDTYLISIGRLVRRKGYDYLLHALAEINKPDLKLIILGEGPEKENLEKLIKENGLENRVICSCEIKK